jgi:hypothetical protein
MASFNLVSPRDFIPRTFGLFSKNKLKGYGLVFLGKDCIAGFTAEMMAMPPAKEVSRRRKEDGDAD